MGPETISPLLSIWRRPETETHESAPKAFVQIVLYDQVVSLKKLLVCMVLVQPHSGRTGSRILGKVRSEVASLAHSGLTHRKLGRRVLPPLARKDPACSGLF